MTNRTAQDLGHWREVTEPCKVQREYPDSPIQPSLQDLMHRIDEDRIGAYHDQRKSPLPVALYFDEPIERQQHQKNPARAVQG